MSSAPLSASAVGVYVHVPFCRRRCFYCDFPIQVVGDRKSTVDEESQGYVKYLLQDIDTTCLDILQTYPHITNVDSLYFGGGTPSLLHPRCKRLYRTYSMYRYQSHLHYSMSL